MTEATLGATIIEAMSIQAEMRQTGHTEGECRAALEQTLRTAWPKGRDLEWRHVCEPCRDYGLVMYECPGDSTCGRTTKHGPHEYGEPCDCGKGRLFKAKARRVEDEPVAAGRAKSRPMARWGQR